MHVCSSLLLTIWLEVTWMHESVFEAVEDTSQQDVSDPEKDFSCALVLSGPSPSSTIFDDGYDVEVVVEEGC